MTKALKWQIAFALLFVFVAGVAVGVFGTVHQARRFMFDHRPDRLRGRLSEHLRRELQLTPEQFAKVQPVVEQTSERLERIRAETGRRVAETMRESHAQIVPVLTDEQRAKLERMEEHHRRMLRRHGMPPPPP